MLTIRNVEILKGVNIALAKLYVVGVEEFPNAYMFIMSKDYNGITGVVYIRISREPLSNGLKKLYKVHRDSKVVGSTIKTDMENVDKMINLLARIYFL